MDETHILAGSSQNVQLETKREGDEAGVNQQAEATKDNLLSKP